MRLIKVFGLGAALVFAGWIEASGQTAPGDNIAATWHFAGSAQLANNTNFDNAKKILTLDSSVGFRDLALSRFSSWLAKSLFLTTNADAAIPLRPLLDDLLSAESFWALGGTSNGPLNFIVALGLDDRRAQVWQATLPKVTGGPGAAFAMKSSSLPGWQWKLAGGQSLWLVRAKDWLLVGGGEDLSALQTQYLRAIEPKRPARPCSEPKLAGSRPGLAAIGALAARLAPPPPTGPRQDHFHRPESVAFHDCQVELSEADAVEIRPLAHPDQYHPRSLDQFYGRPGHRGLPGPRRAAFPTDG